MFRPLELFIGLRYTRAKRRNQFISFISTVSIVCIAISVVALITVMSVMNGFDYQMRSRILGAISHATVSGIGESVQDWPRALQIAEANPHVLGAAPYVESEAMLLARRSSGALVRGVEPTQEPKVVDIDKHMLEGKLSELTPGSWNIVLGRELAMTLGVAVGDRLFSVITGITRDDAELWVTSHYGSLLTYTVGYPIEGIEAGHSVTGTPFSEALFALGIAGIPVFGLLAGIVTGVVYKRIARAMAEGRPMSAALWSNYFVWFVFAWLNAGDMAQLFHVSAIIGAVAAKLMLSFMAGLLRLAPSSPPDTLQSVRTP